MSRIEDLIAKYCPTGVEYKTLGDLGTFMRGGGPQKKHLLSSGNLASITDRFILATVFILVRPCLLYPQKFLILPE